MNGPQTPTTRLTQRRPGDAAGQTTDYAGIVYEECELCESTRRLQEAYEMYVCAECEETYLP